MSSYFASPQSRPQTTTNLNQNSQALLMDLRTTPIHDMSIVLKKPRVQTAKSNGRTVASLKPATIESLPVRPLTTHTQGQRKQSRSNYIHKGTTTKSARPGNGQINPSLSFWMQDCSSLMSQSYHNKPHTINRAGMVSVNTTSNLMAESQKQAAVAVRSRSRSKNNKGDLTSNKSFIQKLEDDLTMKADRNYQLAINGFVQPQMILTKSDFIRPPITAKGSQGQYLNFREVESRRNTILSHQMTGGESSEKLGRVAQSLQLQHEMESQSMASFNTPQLQTGKKLTDPLDQGLIGMPSIDIINHSSQNIKPKCNDIKGPSKGLMQIQPIPKEPPYDQVKYGFLDNPYCLNTASYKQHSLLDGGKEAIPWGGKSIPGYVQDRHGHIYTNNSIIHQLMKLSTPESPQKRVIQETKSTVTLLGKKKIMDQPIAKWQPPVKQFPTGTLVVFKADQFSPDDNLQVVGSEPPTRIQVLKPTKRPQTATRPINYLSKKDTQTSQRSIRSTSKRVNNLMISPNSVNSNFVGSQIPITILRVASKEETSTMNPYKRKQLKNLSSRVSGAYTTKVSNTAMRNSFVNQNNINSFNLSTPSNAGASQSGVTRDFRVRGQMLNSLNEAAFNNEDLVFLEGIPAK
ncbi:hypothetical protein FGO68_gene2427 [Halteria grandinella]|uniref:Uncharacterized protein n=1 Tax=Halteria grandinella TaxID=5974 RepID=A0A8J8NT47_HALGN|nr:hypothetical protein FGO68_gene2427 [Halteria grandinella]